MDFSKIKLVVSDMDGTLLNKSGCVSSRFFSQFQELKKHNIHFVAASGRQYHSIVDKLDAIKDEISIIAENGSFMQHDNISEVLLQLSKEDVKQCIEKLRGIKHSNIILCGRNSAYIETNHVEFITTLSKYYHTYKVVTDLTKVVNDDFLKIALYHSTDSENIVSSYLHEVAENFQVTFSGENWLDISHKKANKGYALTMIQEKLGVTKDETLVFGDYNNDLQMLDLAYFSYAMENAHPLVKETARFKTESNLNGGVEVVIDKLLRAKM